MGGPVLHGAGPYAPDQDGPGRPDPHPRGRRRRAAGRGRRQPERHGRPRGPGRPRPRHRRAAQVPGDDVGLPAPGRHPVHRRPVERGLGVRQRDVRGQGPADHGGRLGHPEPGLPGRPGHGGRPGLRQAPERGRHHGRRRAVACRRLRRCSGAGLGLLRPAVRHPGPVAEDLRQHDDRGRGAARGRPRQAERRLRRGLQGRDRPAGQGRLRHLRTDASGRLRTGQGQQGARQAPGPDPREGRRG